MLCGHSSTSACAAQGVLLASGTLDTMRSFCSHQNLEEPKEQDHRDQLPAPWLYKRNFDLRDAANGPDVHLKAVPLLAQHLWGNVVGGPTQGHLALAIILYLGGQAKVTWRRQGVTGDALEGWSLGWGPMGAAMGGHHTMDTYQSSPPCHR